MSGVLKWSTRITLVFYQWSVELEHKDNRGMCYELHWCAMSGVLSWSTRITLVCYEWSVELGHKDYTGVL